MGRQVPVPRAARRTGAGLGLAIEGAGISSSKTRKRHGLGITVVLLINEDLQARPLSRVLPTCTPPFPLEARLTPVRHPFRRVLAVDCASCWWQSSPFCTRIKNRSLSILTRRVRTDLKIANKCGRPTSRARARSGPALAVGSIWLHRRWRSLERRAIQRATLSSAEPVQRRPGGRRRVRGLCTRLRNSLLVRSLLGAQPLFARWPAGDTHTVHLISGSKLPNVLIPSGHRRKKSPGAPADLVRQHVAVGGLRVPKPCRVLQPKVHVALVIAVLLSVLVQRLKCALQEQNKALGLATNLMLELPADVLVPRLHGVHRWLLHPALKRCLCLVNLLLGDATSDHFSQ
mmetsp:Transcript_33802/g.81844  ORF Transcript_33802/g.81844 Transcript_33802/m.81844 type:complete len:345 (-) Transcript_33802:133-1167(-)